MARQRREGTAEGSTCFVVLDDLLKASEVTREQAKRRLMPIDRDPIETLVPAASQHN